MTPEQAASYVFAEAVSALIEVEAMKAANREREQRGYALAYDEAAFFKVAERYCIGHNDVSTIFRDANQR